LSDDEMRSLRSEGSLHRFREGGERIDTQRISDPGRPRHRDEIRAMRGRGRNAPRAFVHLVVEYDLNKIAWSHATQRHQTVEVHQDCTVAVEHNDLPIWQRQCEPEPD